MLSMTDGLYNNTAYPRIQFAKIHFFLKKQKTTQEYLTYYI